MGPVFGKSFIKRILEEYNVSKVIVYSRDELKQFEMQTSKLLKYLLKKTKLDILLVMLGTLIDLKWL